MGSMVALAFLVFARLWVDPTRRYLIDGASDQQLFEWFFAQTAHALVRGDDLLFSNFINFPTGINVMANTASFGLSIPLAPVTLTLGASVTWAIVLVVGLAGTAIGWYWLMSRYLVTSRLGAAIGAALAGFAPSMLSQAQAHPQMMVLFPVPFIVIQLIKLYRGQRIVLNGILLGLIVTWQLFIGEEALMIAAIGIATFIVAWAAMHWTEFRSRFRTTALGVAIGAAVSLVICAYPLWFQFTGPQSYSALLHGPSGNPLESFWSFSTESLLGHAEIARQLSMNRTEENSFFGWPLLALTIALVVWLWKRKLARVLMIVIVVAAALSLGPKVVIGGDATWMPAPWILFRHMPLLDSLLESRLAMICVPAMGILIALGVDRLRKSTAPTRYRVVGYAAIALALLPIFPTPLRAVDREPLPEFFADGTYRSYVPEGGTVVPVPPTVPGDVDAYDWQVKTGMEFHIPEGYFVGPWDETGRASYGAYPRPMSWLLRRIRDGEALPITEADKAQAKTDLEFWKASVVVLGDQPNRSELKNAVDELLGEEGELIGGLYVWRVTP